MNRFPLLMLVLGIGLGFWLWSSGESSAPARASPVALPPPDPPPVTVAGGADAPDCSPKPRFTRAAAHNAETIDTLAWSPFRRAEIGWRTYAPLISSEIGSNCSYDSEAFADRLAGWQAARGLAATGELDPASFEVMVVAWHRRRPFVRLSQSGCPAAPDPASLAVVPPAMTYGPRPMRLRADALAALERMVADARAADPAIARDRQALLVFSAFRAPADDDLRCQQQSNCDNVVRAPCSAHRTGLAVDLVVGARPGGRVDSAEDANRLFQSQTPAYRWLARNARRYGFVPYVYEPWHWEWTGEGMKP